MGPINDALLQEIQQRTRRTETRLMRLCDYMGIDPTNKIRCILANDGTIALNAMDVGIGECLRFAKEKGILGVITLTYAGAAVGTLNVK